MHTSSRQLRNLGPVIALMLLTPLVTPAQADEYDGRKDFDIRAQPMDAALIEFSEQANLQVLIATELVMGLRSKVVKGWHLPADALAMLIDGTDLKFQAIGEDTIAVSMQIRALPDSRNASSINPVNDPAADECIEMSIAASERTAGRDEDCKN